MQVNGILTAYSYKHAKKKEIGAEVYTIMNIL